MNTPTIMSGGYIVNTDPTYLGELKDSKDLFHDTQALHQRMQTDGYLLFRGVLDVEKVLAARKEVIEKLVTVGEIDTTRPIMDAFSSGLSQRKEVGEKTFNKSLRLGSTINAACNQDTLIHFFEEFLGGTVRSPEYIWVRTMHPRRSTPSHIDLVFMGRGTRNMYSAWIPLGDVSRTLGGLMVLEGSNNIVQQTDYVNIDVDRDVHSNHPLRCGLLSNDPNEVQKQYGGRWLTTDFKSGDIICFSAITIHCSLDNLTSGKESQIRISCDTSYQLAAEPVDERWSGVDPAGHSEEHHKACR